MIYNLSEEFNKMVNIIKRNEYKQKEPLQDSAGLQIAASPLKGDEMFRSIRENGELGTPERRKTKPKTTCLLFIEPYYYSKAIN